MSGAGAPSTRSCEGSAAGTCCPVDDVGARNNLRRRFGLPSTAGYDAVAELARAWWPYGGLVYFHLLLDALATAGHVTPSLSSTDKSVGVRPAAGSRPGRRVMTTIGLGNPPAGDEARSAVRSAFRNAGRDQ